MSATSAIERIITLPAALVALGTTLLIPITYAPALPVLGMDPAVVIQVQMMLIKYGVWAIVIDGVLNFISGWFQQDDRFLYDLDVAMTRVRSVSVIATAIFVFIAVSTPLFNASITTFVQQTLTIRNASLLLGLAIVVTLLDLLVFQPFKTHRRFGFRLREATRDAGPDVGRSGDISAVERRGREQLRVDRDVVRRTRYWEELDDGTWIPEHQPPGYVLAHIDFHYADDNDTPRLERPAPRTDSPATGTDTADAASG